MMFDSESILKNYYSHEGQELREMGRTHVAVLLLVDTQLLWLVRKFVQ